MLGTFFGHLFGDSWIQKLKTCKNSYYFRYTNNEETLINEMKTCLENRYNIKIKKIYKYSYKSNKINYMIQLGKKDIVDQIKKDIITFNINNLSDNDQRLFLKAVFDDDGCITNKYHIYYGTTKMKTYKMVKYLLKKHGFHVAIWHGKFYQIRLSKLQNKKYHDLIGFNHPKKNEKLEYYINNCENGYSKSMFAGKQIFR